MVEYDEDVQLMLRFKDGDNGAFESLYRKHATPLAGYFWRSTRSSAAADELVQETFFKIHRLRASYEPRASFRTYLFVVARSVLLSKARKRHEHELPEQIENGHRPGPEREVSSRELLHKVGQALASLPERQRTAIQMVRYEGMSYEEAAAVLGVSQKAMKSLLNRARTQLLEQVAI